ncbi:DNA excision repair protein ERCC-8-like [Oppia nitens]|uniref:DNA excision repair protein ERCC-8-like n=1 Tax=Oppia nitens TaxID=1686743 RepID=UPI0023DB4307|nr:DNA excision repair protein ERCC-8-like [Oppia nitens]
MSLSQDVINRQLFADKCVANRHLLSTVLSTHPMVCSDMKTYNSVINYIDIDTIDYKFLLVGHNDGFIDINEITDQNIGDCDNVIHKKVDAYINRCQWFPADTGMFATTSGESVTVIDTNAMKRVDRFQFDNLKVYWSDWSPNTNTLIAVGCSASTIRLIDIRSGSSLQQITCCSKTGSVNHHMTRVLWSPLDSDCLIAGDSSGYLHIYDIRRPNKAVTVVGCDNVSYEPITCLQFTKNNMSLLTTKGRSNKLNLWHLMHCQLLPSDINFDCPLVRSKQSKQIVSFIKCQIFATDDYVFTPSEHKLLGNDVISYDITNGMIVHELNTTREGSFNTLGPNCVTGLDIGSLVLFSGGSKRLCVWTPNSESEDDIKRDKYYTDRWSDSE